MKKILVTGLVASLSVGPLCINAKESPKAKKDKQIAMSDNGAGQDIVKQIQDIINQKHSRIGQLPSVQAKDLITVELQKAQLGLLNQLKKMNAPVPKPSFLQQCWNDYTGMLSSGFRHAIVYTGTGLTLLIVTYYGVPYLIAYAPSWLGSVVSGFGSVLVPSLTQASGTIRGWLGFAPKPTPVGPARLHVPGTIAQACFKKFPLADQAADLGKCVGGGLGNLKQELHVETVPVVEKVKPDWFQYYILGKQT